MSEKKITISQRQFWSSFVVKMVDQLGGGLGRLFEADIVRVILRECPQGSCPLFVLPFRCPFHSGSDEAGQGTFVPAADGVLREIIDHVE
jgi:hypothetical protein